MTVSNDKTTTATTTHTSLVGAFTLTALTSLLFIHPSFAFTTRITSPLQPTFYSKQQQQQHPHPSNAPKCEFNSNTQSRIGFEFESGSKSLCMSSSFNNNNNNDIVNGYNTYSNMMGNTNTNNNRNENTSSNASTTNSNTYTATNNAVASNPSSPTTSSSSNTATSNKNNNNNNNNGNQRNMNTLTEWATKNKFILSPTIQITPSPTPTPMAVPSHINNNPNNINMSESDPSNYGVTFTHPSYYDPSQSGSTILSVPKTFVFDSKEIYYQWMTEAKIFRSEGITNLQVTQKTKQELIEPALDYIRRNGNFNLYLNHFLLVIKLYEEWKRGRNSQWYDWMASLPKSNLEFKTGVNMDEIEISCLPPFALALANHEKEKLNLFYEAFQLIPTAFWDHLHDDTKMNPRNGDTMEGARRPEDVRPFFTKRGSEGGLKNTLNGEEEDDSMDEDHILNKEAFKWIFNIVHTRCWSYEDEGDDGSRPIIVPLGDMFNHKEPANVFVQDSPTSSVVEFIYSSEMGDEDEININQEEKNKGLYLSYGLKNPHRFLIIFGFCDTTMPEIFSQLIFSNPSREMIQMGCNDRAEMVYRTEDGSISNAIWDCVLYTLLNQVPLEQREFYQAYASRDYVTLKKYHEKYLLEAALTLRPHVMNNIGEQRELLGRIDGIIEMVESTGDYISDVHPRLLMIRKHNEFLCNVFEMVREQLDKIAQSEVKKRREAQEDPNGYDGFPQQRDQRQPPPPPPPPRGQPRRTRNTVNSMTERGYPYPSN